MPPKMDAAKLAERQEKLDREARENRWKMAALRDPEAAHMLTALRSLQRAHGPATAIAAIARELDMRADPDFHVKATVNADTGDEAGA